MQDKEIELKFLINNDTKAKIIADLEKLATKGKQSHQIDTYYIPNFAEFEKDGETMECLRIREQNGRSVLCYKKIHREANPIYCDEYETEIESKKNFLNFGLAKCLALCYNALYQKARGRARTPC